MFYHKKGSIRVNSSEPLIKSPIHLLNSLKNDIVASRELSWRLFQRNLSARYRHSILGLLWAFLPPLVTAAIWIFLQHSNIINISPTNIPYPVYVLVGTLCWKTFSDSINMPLSSFLGARSMLARIEFPREALLISGFGDIILNSLIRTVIILAILLISGIGISKTFILFPVGLFALMILGTSIGIFLVPAGVLYHDVSRGLGFAVQFLFYLTPIVYPTPKEWPLSLLATVNPITPIINTARNWATGIPNSAISTFFIITTVASIALFIGWIILKVTLPHLIERISN